MMWEWLRGSESPWAPYINILPQESDALIFWDEAEVKELEGCPVVNKINKEREEMKLLKRVIPLTRTESFTASMSLPLQLEEGRRLMSVEEYQKLALRMSATIMAYSFDLEREVKAEKPSTDTANEGKGCNNDHESAIMVSYKAMIPVADMLNCDYRECHGHVSIPIEIINIKTRPINSSKKNLKADIRYRSLRYRGTIPSFI